MQDINQVLDALERACETEDDLLAYAQPNLSEIVEVLKTLPPHERDAMRDRLERVATIIEGKMMLYGEEMERLGGQIRQVASSNAAASAYRVAAVIPVAQNEGK